MSPSVVPVKNSVLLLLLMLLLVLFRGPHLLYGALSLLLVTLYYFFTDHRLTPAQIAERGFLGRHLLVSLLLCTLVIWATTGREESHYWIIYLLPIITGASVLNLGRSLALCLLASFCYLTLVPPAEYLHDPSELPEFLIPCIALFFVGVLVQSHAEQSRRQLRRQQQLNQQLSANEEALRQSLQKLRTTEDSLRRQDRLAALGEMSAGLAHEIRNPLGVIRSSAQLLSATAEAPADPLLAVIAEESDRLNQLLSRFLDFGRPLQPQRAPCDLVALLQQAHDALLPAAEQQGVRLNLFVPPAPLVLAVDAALLRQAIDNLLLNAVQACQPGDHVTLSLTKRRQQVCLSVEDSGCGIAAADLPHIFNPFFTRRKGGTGLGLANAHKAVTLHQGEIQLHSQPGSGSTFSILLPLTAPSQETDHGPHPDR
ncbi:sensor histidine kinase [Desulfuromonas thiophila]|uniref:sensor histidine kinase n=1 Tax=Desulfuromonas thiophila TaxID=57664 RepID=UPI0024A8A477|nr:ATP-binding protein [Desulfuromonas thiophila]